MCHWEAFDISETKKRYPFISIPGKSNEKDGHNIATKRHNTVLWVIFTAFFMKRQDIYNGMILARPRKNGTF